MKQHFKPKLNSKKPGNDPDDKNELLIDGFPIKKTNQTKENL